MRGRDICCIFNRWWKLVQDLQGFSLPKISSSLIFFLSFVRIAAKKGQCEEGGVAFCVCFCWIPCWISKAGWPQEWAADFVHAWVICMGKTVITDNISILHRFVFYNVLICVRGGTLLPRKLPALCWSHRGFHRHAHQGSLYVTNQGKMFIPQRCSR